jgi:ubiquinone/menaquinone biosynthesis C-methylase UbiE
VKPGKNPLAVDGADEFPTRLLAARYGREAAVYRELWSPILRKAAARLVGELRGGHVARVLDVGTGVGSLLPDLRAAFPAAFVIGVDRSPGMIGLAPAELPRAIMDARQLALPSVSVDRVILAFVLFHLEQPLAGLREARRVLRAGGRVGTLTWAATLESKATRIWNECLEHHGAVAPDPATQTRHEDVDTPKKMTKLLDDAGFASIRSWAETLLSHIGADHLIRLRTSMGSCKPRFDSLDTRAQADCVAEARHRLKGLAPEDFMARGKIIHALGCVGS